MEVLVSGGIIMCGGASVCWFSRTQKCATLSTSEAEYVANSSGINRMCHVLPIQ